MVGVWMDAWVCYVGVWVWVCAWVGVWVDVWMDGVWIWAGVGECIDGCVGVLCGCIV